MALDLTNFDECKSCIVIIQDDKPITKDFVIQQYNNLVNYIQNVDETLGGKLNSEISTLNLIYNLKFINLPIVMNELINNFARLAKLFNLVDNTINVSLISFSYEEIKISDLINLLNKCITIAKA